jgi:hypothetical protein
VGRVSEGRRAATAVQLGTGCRRVLLDKRECVTGGDAEVMGGGSDNSRNSGSREYRGKNTYSGLQWSGSGRGGRLRIRDSGSLEDLGLWQSKSE